MEGSEVQEDDGNHDPGLSEAPTGAPAPGTEDQPGDEEGGVNESHPTEGDIEEATENAE